jgi:DNA-binding CsgD family transcriptional regulator
MADLAARDYARLFDLAVAVLDADAGETPLPLVAREISTCLRGDFGAFACLEPAANAGRMTALPERLRHLPPDVFPRRIDEHPMTRHYVGTGDTTPRTLGEVDPDRSWRRSADYHRLREATGVTQQIVILLHAAPGFLRSVTVARVGGRDFGARDRAVARRLQPLLIRVDNHLRELRRVRPEAGSHDLTPRELTVLALLAGNLTAAAIARRLGVSVSTVNTHLERIYRKLGTNNRLTTVLMAHEAALIPRRR